MSDFHHYDPKIIHGRTFHDARARFVAGEDTPRDYLERCLHAIEAREPTVKAWVVHDPEAARAAADAATARYRDGRPLSAVDGMPIGIKDLIETRDFPTGMGSALYADNATGRDSASVYALRRGGAIILGKTVTTELGMSHPGPTTNPFDPGRTPGGSSSGSAAAVGAAMVPAALGSQVVGSIIRPAAFCGNVAIKPTLGALNRGERLMLSQSHLGVHASSIEDMWSVAWQISSVGGGDPGYPGLYGAPQAGEPVRPRRLALVESEGWSAVEPAVMDAFEQVLAQLTAQGVTIVRRTEHPGLDAFERAISTGLALCRDVCGYEMRWQLWNWRDRDETLLSRSMRRRLTEADGMTPDDYRARLEERETMRRLYRALAPDFDACITLACAGPAPAFDPASQALDTETPNATGLPAFNGFTSAVGMPCITLPLLSADAMPVGVQVMGQWHEDWALARVAAWMRGQVEAVRA